MRAWPSQPAVDGEGGRESGGDEPSSSSRVSGVIVTSLEAESTVVYRFFGPWMGIDEDPATGSAHAVLAPLWDKELRRRRREEGRGGVAGVVAAENNAAEGFTPFSLFGWPDRHGCDCGLRFSPRRWP
jgi:TctA family transporter